MGRPDVEKGLRSNQQDGYVFEAFAKASAIVENLNRLSKNLPDPELRVTAAELYRRGRNEREQARTRMGSFDDLNTEILGGGQPEDYRKKLIEERDKLVGEIFIRLFHIDLLQQTANKRLS